MSIIAWEVRRYSKAPERKEYARETASFYVRSNGRRDAKETSYSKIYADHGEAMAAIRRRVEREENNKRIDLVHRAAPDLLEALEASTLLLRTKRHACENPEVCHVLDVHIARNSAAIAKAKGESNEQE
jgi:hypothetical protein